MAIAGNEAIAMVDFDEVAIAVDPAGHGDFTGCRRPDRRPVVDADVDAFMEAGTAANRIAAITEVRRDCPADGPDGRRRRRAAGIAVISAAQGTTLIFMRNLLHLPNLFACRIAQDRLQGDEADDAGVTAGFQAGGGQ